MPDSDLKNMSNLCVSLCYLNINGCTSVTDFGISIVIRRCRKMHSILACETAFGQDSVQILCSCVETLDHSADPNIGTDPGQTLAYKLQTLQIGGCKGVEEHLITGLMSKLYMIKNLCLNETQLIDVALYKFVGSLLEVLDVSNSKVSGDALAHVVRQNPNLKCLKVRGYSNLSHRCNDICMELGKFCKLEEIELGWGFSSISVKALKPALKNLKSIAVGLGGKLGLDGLYLLCHAWPSLESLKLYFQVISDNIMQNITECLRRLHVLAFCYCFGEISSLSFAVKMPNLRKLRVERVMPRMTNDDLKVLVENCASMTELSLIGCRLLNAESQAIISSGWPGLVSIRLEECGEVTKNGVVSLFNCRALEEISLRHNYANRYFLTVVTIAKCKRQKCSLDLYEVKFTGTTSPVHKETFVLVWDSKKLTRTLIKERL